MCLLFLLWKKYGKLHFMNYARRTSVLQNEGLKIRKYYNKGYLCNLSLSPSAVKNELVLITVSIL